MIGTCLSRGEGDVIEEGAISACLRCGRPIARKAHGRTKRYCSGRCQRAAHRSFSDKKIAESTKGLDREKPPEIAIEIIEETLSENAISKKEANSALRFEKVNDVAWKLTDGAMERTPASHGQWAGYNSTRALADVIDVGWVADKSSWIARYRDKSVGPTTFAEAKRAAMLLYRGGSDDLQETIRKPVNWLNILQASLIKEWVPDE
jgi:endogenous inhibitor of DNA gyrase (YacG/DUF329 family)